MAVTIRLTRVGKKKNPSYRVVVADQRRKRDGHILEAVGHYDPRKEPIALVLKSERIQYWVGKGARPTNTVSRLIKRNTPKA